MHMVRTRCCKQLQVKFSISRGPALLTLTALWQMAAPS